MTLYRPRPNSTEINRDRLALGLPKIGFPKPKKRKTRKKGRSK
jgi:hypothetical protein